MQYTTIGKILPYKNNQLILQFDNDFDANNYFNNNQCEQVILKFLDARIISHDQRKKIYALIKDISDHVASDKEYTKDALVSEFCFLKDIAHFSLSDVDMSTASLFINYLVEFCLKHAIPLTDYLIKNMEDIQHYLYNCLKYKRCVVCGMSSEFHHCTGSRTGGGRKSTEIPLTGLKGMALCRIHHTEIHSDAEFVFYNKYHVEPIIVDNLIASKYPHYKQEDN